jgi:hypothetical protein
MSFLLTKSILFVHRFCVLFQTMDHDDIFIFEIHFGGRFKNLMVWYMLMVILLCMISLLIVIVHF